MKTWHNLMLFAVLCITWVIPMHAAGPPTKIDRPVVKLGDTWIYTKSIGSNVRTFTYKVIELQPGGGYQVEAQSSAASVAWRETFDSNGNVVTDYLSTFSPSRDVIRFPLEVGKLYKGGEFTRINKKDSTSKFTMQTKIKSITQEKVTVKAGTFNALKVEAEISYDGRTTRGNNLSNVMVETYWFAPEVGRYVKRDFNDLGNKGLETWELESFKRGE